ncbi:glycosyltransferase family 4 protein [Pseudoduganella chitinolytica]|uniref:Glycosyltransferase family 4 protein n=1 Tax=Pseudoduganella chitinolytica TaxID=34070 RepID=A0ABY8BL37_9BURK|nr:glycosyltransferase family 4 protein [Pseudoduganella chitinolytica]WEF35668.1 glycosyltransferase family 4 protein [Pseudoduganella chitinolytica]
MKKIVMMGTSRGTKGGIASVVQVYEDAGLFGRFPIRYIATHRDGGALGKVRAMLCAYVTLLGMLLRGQVALLHVHLASRASFWRKYPIFLLGRLFGVPTILHLHGGGFMKFYEEECGKLRKWMVRNVYDNATHVLVLSGQWERWVRSMTRNPNVQALYNPVIAEPTTVPWSARDAGTVLVLGRLNRAKGTYDLLQAAAQLPAELAHARLRLGGDGEIEQAGAAVRELGLQDRVDLLGWVGPADKPALLNTATVYALPSYHEGLPMSVLEAMAAGLPVVTTPVGGIPEAVTDGVEGFLVEPGDVTALRDRLQLLLSDRALAQRMGEAGRRKVEQLFLSSTIMPRVERLYLQLGAAPSGPAAQAGTLAGKGAAPN